MHVWWQKFQFGWVSWIWKCKNTHLPVCWELLGEAMRIVGQEGEIRNTQIQKCYFGICRAGASWEEAQISPNSDRRFQVHSPRMQPLHWKSTLHKLHISPFTLQATKYILDTANNRQCTVNNTPVHNRLHLTQMGRAQLYKAVPQCISCTVLCIEHCTQHALECTAIGFVSSSEQTACLHLWLPANPSPLASPSSSSLSSSPSLS